MCDVGPVAKGIEHEHIEAFQKGHAFGRNFVGVSAIGHVADAEAQNVKARPVLKADGHDSAAQEIKWLGRNPPKVKLRGCARVGWLPVKECVVERLANSLFNG